MNKNRSSALFLLMILMFVIEMNFVSRAVSGETGCFILTLMGMVSLIGTMQLVIKEES